MSDAPSNLPLDPMDEVPMSPVAPSAPVPPAPPSPPAPPVPLVEPIVPPVAPPVPRQAPPVASKPVEDVFAGIETAPIVRPIAEQTNVPLPPPASGGHGWSIALAVLGLLFLVGAGVGTWWYFFQPTSINPSAQDVIEEPSSIVPPPAQEPTIFDSGRAIDAPPQVVPLPEPVTTPPSGTSIPTPVSINEVPPTIPTAPDASSSTPSTQPEASIQFDTDGDGLTDSREQELGTSPSRFDTDGDTLGDGQEVMTYSTNPLNPDTDGDGFPDGVEIQNGFNPRGTGKCSQSDCRL